MAVRRMADLAFMIDQSHNLKGKVEAMVQTVVTAQELYAQAALVDQEQLAELQQQCRLVEAEECFRVGVLDRMCGRWCGSGGGRAVCRRIRWRALRESGYVEQIATRARRAEMRMLLPATPEGSGCS